jgi:high-affinity iron transporter
MGAGFFSSACHELEEIIGLEEIVLWELNCCDPSKEGGWDLAAKLFGWRNKATVASTIGYFLYWIIIILYVLFIYTYKVHDNNNIQPELQQQSQPENDITMQEISSQSQLNTNESNV